MIERPKVLSGTTVKQRTPCGNLYVTVNFPYGNVSGDDPIEVIPRLGKSGGCPAALLGTIGRLASLALQYGVPVKDIRMQMSGVSCYRSDVMHPCCVQGIADVLKSVSGEDSISNEDSGKMEPSSKGLVSSGVCPECGSPMVKSEGCDLCHSCGYSKCG